jgi:hypothetical protein
MDKKNEKKNCIDCEVETDDYYPISTNRGKIFRCAECHESWIRRSTRMEHIKTSYNQENNCTCVYMVE